MVTYLRIHVVVSYRWLVPAGRSGKTAYRVPDILCIGFPALLKEGLAHDGKELCGASCSVGVEARCFVERFHRSTPGQPGYDLKHLFVGQLKRDDILHYKSPLEMEMMRAIKRTFDPQGL